MCINKLIYRLMVWWLNHQLARAEEGFDGMGVDRLVNAIESLRGQINAG